MSMFLDREEVTELTDYRRSKEQIRELRRRGIPFLVSRLGKPQVLREALLDIGGVNSRSKPNETINTEALEAMNHGKKSKN